MKWVKNMIGDIELVVFGVVGLVLLAGCITIAAMMLVTQKDRRP
jgi:hypothetical protein